MNETRNNNQPQTDGSIAGRSTRERTPMRALEPRATRNKPRKCTHHTSMPNASDIAPSRTEVYGEKYLVSTRNQNKNKQVEATPFRVHIV